MQLVDTLCRAHFQTNDPYDALMVDTVHLVHLHFMLEDSRLLEGIPPLSIYIKDSYQEIQRTLCKICDSHLTCQ